VKEEAVKEEKERDGAKLKRRQKKTDTSITEATYYP
jgi:hypothetical protein